MKIENNIIYADEGKYLYRRSSNVAFKMGTLLEGETIYDFEEVSELKPEFEPYNYDEEVNRLIRERYSESQEFAILRQKDEKPLEFKEYYDYAEDCKKLAKTDCR